VADEAGHVGWARLMWIRLQEKRVQNVKRKVVLPDSLVSWFKLVFPPIFHFSNFSIN
jgi:hypothetical protein